MPNVLTVADGRLTNEFLPEAKALAASLCFSNNFLDPILLFATTERCQTA